MTIAARMGRHLPTTIRGRLVLGISTVLGAIALFVVISTPRQLAREAMEMTAEKAEALGEVTAYGLVASVLFDDTTNMQTVIAGTRQDPDVLYVVAEDANGRILAASDVAAARAAGYRNADEHNPIATGDVYRIVESIRHEELTIGRVYLGLSLASLNARVARIRRDVVIINVILLGGAILIVFGIGSVVTRPLTRMAGVARRVSTGDLRQRVNLDSDDEVGTLAHAFDTMVEKVESAYDELKELNRGLEARVAERTMELRTAYDERLRAESAALRSERRFRAMFESAPVAITLIDRDWRLMEVNPAFETMWRGSRSQLVGRRADELCDPNGSETALDEIREIMAGRRERMQSEIRCHPLNGPAVWGHAAAAGVRDEDGKVQFVLAMIEDVTSEKELTDQLRQSQKLEAIGRLAGGVAHDFNNLLTTINGLAALMLADLRGAEHLRKDITEVARAGERAANLTRQLLAFSRRQVLQPRVMDVNAAMRDLGAMLRRLIGEDITLDLRLEGTLPNVRADAGQFGQIIMNLAVNARDAMPLGGMLAIETDAVDLDAETAQRFGTVAGRTVRIRVRDTGHGMTPATMARIFEPFFTTKDVGKGTGLGLATVYGIVKQSNGGIGVESEVGAGTTFTVLLPATEAHTEPSPEERAAVAPATGTETVLLVEDEEAVRALAARILRRSGYVVIEHETPESALEDVASQEKAHAILTDVIMPGMSGPDLVRQIHERVPSLRVLYMSGYPREQVSHLGLAGEYGFIQKPMSPSDLAAAMRTLLDGQLAPAS